MPGWVFTGHREVPPTAPLPRSEPRVHTHLDPFIGISLLYDLQPLALCDGQLVLMSCLGPTKKDSGLAVPHPCLTEVPTSIHT